MLHPKPADAVDVEALYAADERPGPSHRPWVMVNMIASVDGATAVDGVSGALGGDGDRAVFAAVRSVADVVVAASATVNAERYGPARPSTATRDRRTARGQEPAPRIVVITGSLGVDLDIPLFAPDTEPKPLVLTGRSAPSARRRVVEDRAEIRNAGDDGVDLATAFGLLNDDGVDVALVEGGPSLNGQLVEHDLVDELCLSVAPTLAGGASKRIVAGGDAVGRGMRLDRVLVDDDGALFLRYVRPPTT